MPRLLFEKTGNGIWMSHLDLMRLFQRAFKRAGLALKHSQGFNPRPMVSIALPLSVGVASRCEMLDFELEGEPVNNENILHSLNGVLVDGVNILDVYDDGRKIKDIALLDCSITLEYDAGVPINACQQIRDLFKNPSVLVDKKSKNGIVKQDIIPMIRKINVEQTDENSLQISCRICCQNPALNPGQIVAAIDLYLPQLHPDFARCERLEVFDTNEVIFR